MPFNELNPIVIKKLADGLNRAQAQTVGLRSVPGRSPEAVGFFFQQDTDETLWSALSGHCQVYLEWSGEEECFLASISALQAENRRLRQRTVIDRGSGLYSKIYFQEALATETARMSRFNLPLSLLLIKLKKPGRHTLGSRIFNATAELILKYRRRLDQAARYQRDTLALIMPDTSRAQALTTAKRLKVMITDSWAELVSQNDNPPSEIGEVLIGLAEATPGIRAKEARELLAEAREALRLAARHDGIWPDPQPGGPEPGTTIKISEKEVLFAGFQELVKS